MVGRRLVSGDKRYRRTGTLVFASIGLVIAVGLFMLLTYGLILTNHEFGWGETLTLAFLVLWAIDKADDVKLELDKPPRPRYMPREDQ